MYNDAQQQLRASRAARRAASGYEPTTYSPPQPTQPKIFGRNIETNTATLDKKSIAGRFVNDASLLAYGVITGVSKLGTQAVQDPVGAAKTVVVGAAKGVYQTGKDIAGVAGFLGKKAQQESIDYYTAHPLFAALDAFGVASLGAGAILKSGITSTARSATEVAMKEAVKAGVDTSAIDSALSTTRGAFNPKRWFGSDRKTSKPFYNVIEDVVRNGQVEKVAEVVTNQFIKQGVKPEVAVKIAQATAQDIAKSIISQSKKIKIADAIYHPVNKLGRSTQKVGAPVGRFIFGTGEKTAVAKAFGVDLVKENKKTALGLERWLEAVVNEKGLENTLDNRLRTLMDWKRQSDFANLTPTQLFHDFNKYVESDIKVRQLRDLTGSNFVPVKVISKEAANAMVTDVRSNIKTIVEEVAGTIKESDPMRRTSMVFDKIDELMTEVHGRDWEKYSDVLRKAYGDKGSISNLEKAITTLSSQKSSISFVKWSKKAQDIAKEMEGTGYRIAAAPTSKKVSHVSDVLGNTKSSASPIEQSAQKAVSGGKTLQEFISGQTEVYHGTNKDFNSFDESFVGSGKGSNTRGIWFTSNRIQAEGTAEGLSNLAKIVGKDVGTSRVVNSFLDIKNPKIVDVKNEVLLPDKANEIIKQAKQGEYDSVIFNNVRATDKISVTHTAVINLDIIKTKSQLTDIYNKAKSDVGTQITKSDIPNSAIETKRTYLGKVLDKFGLSTKGVIEGANEFVFGQSFLQNAIKTIGGKFGDTIKLKMPIAVTTTKGVVSRTRNVSIPVSKLYEFLRNHRNQIFRERIGLKGAEAFRPISVFDITRKDLVRFGFAEDVAKVIDSVSRKSLRQTPASVIGAGEKLVNLMRASSVDFAIFGRHYDNFLKASFYMRYQSALSFLFQAQEYLETKLMTSLITKDARFIPGAEAMAGFGAKLIPSRISKRLDEVKYALQKITEEPKLNELVIARDDILPNTQKALEDVLDSPEFARERMGINTAAKKIETTSQIMSRGKMEGLWIRAMGGWTMGTAAKISKAMAQKFGMTLEEATAYTMKNGNKIYKNPRLVREMQDTVQQAIHYKKGFQTSPLIKTLNLIWFPFRFQAKTVAITARWVGSLSPASRLVVINNWVNFANWAGTDEGIKWRKTKKNMFYSLLAYTTAWEQLGDTVNAVGRGQLFGGNTGLIGGIPLGFVSNSLQALAITPEDPYQIDPRTNRPFRARKTPRELLSDTAMLTVFEEYLFTMMPGMPLYTITGGVVRGASYRNLFQNILESGYGWAKASAQGKPTSRSKELLKRDYIRLPFNQTR